MFGLFKPKPAPEGPIKLTFSVLVERPPADVYPLIDWADPRNAKRQLGHSVAAIDGSSSHFRLIMTEMPEHNFDMKVSDATPGADAESGRTRPTAVARMTKGIRNGPIARSRWRRSRRREAMPSILPTNETEPPWVR